jgi:hypothetical protein
MMSAGSLGPGAFLSQGSVSKIIAHELLVKARRTLSRNIAFRRPEARRIRRQHFIHQRKFARIIEAKLELGIRDDDAALARVVGREARRAPSAVARTWAAVPAPSRRSMASKEMFSSCVPAAALVAGVNSGVGRRCASFRPAGNAIPHTLPVRT